MTPLNDTRPPVTVTVTVATPPTPTFDVTDFSAALTRASINLSASILRDASFSANAGSSVSKRTTLTQIAAKGDKHFLVYKDNSSKKTVTEIRALQEEERVEEIAKMIGGAKPSTLAKENARELLGA